MKLLAIDPGNIDSAYVLMDESYKPLEFGKAKNLDVLEIVQNLHWECEVAIEMVASCGMPVGKEVFETCVWIGRFKQACDGNADYIYRKDEKLNLCGQTRARDSNVIQALKDRFGDKGTKSHPGWFYGFAKDVWQAYAVGVTWADKNWKMLERSTNDN